MALTYNRGTHPPACLTSQAITNLACVKGKLAYIQESSAVSIGGVASVESDIVCANSCSTSVRPDKAGAANPLLPHLALPLLQFLNGQAERVCRRSANSPFDDGRPPFYCNGQGTKGIWNEICVAYKVASPSPVVSPSPVMT